MDKASLSQLTRKASPIYGVPYTCPFIKGVWAKRHLNLECKENITYSMSCVWVAHNDDRVSPLDSRRLIATSTIHPHAWEFVRHF